MIIGKPIELRMKRMTCPIHGMRMTTLPYIWSWGTPLGKFQES